MGKRRAWMDQREPSIQLVEVEKRTYEDILPDLVPKLYRVAYGIVQDPMEAQDAVQDAMVNLLAKGEGFEERASISTWLYRVTVNASLDRLRAKRRKGDTVSIEDFLPKFDEEGRYAEEIVDWSQRPLERLLSKEAMETLERALGSLPEDHRIVIVMKDMEEIPLAEIARALDLTIAAVKSRLHRARLALRGVLASYFKEEEKRPMARPKTRRRHKQTCREIVEILCEYLEGELPREEREELDRHLADCPPCLAFLNTYRKTSQLCRALRPEDIPEELKRRVENFLKEIPSRRC